MNLAQFKSAVKTGKLDTVIVAFPDVYGRLMGKRFTARYFADHVAAEGTHACNYLLTVDMEMEPQTGFAVANWDLGFGDFVLRPDAQSLRRIPWLPGTALVLCDYARENGTPVREAPRSVLRQQLDLLARRRWSAFAASELEFFLFNQTYHEAFSGGYRELKAASDYRIDYHTMQPGRDEALFRQVREQMPAAGVPIESSKGEWGRGQHEVNFIYAPPLAMADLHVVFKQGIKELAAQHGKCVTFMPKLAANEVGSSCHVHISLWRARRNVFWNERQKRGSDLFRQFLGGLMK